MVTCQKHVLKSPERAIFGSLSGTLACPLRSQVPFSPNNGASKTTGVPFHHPDLPSPHSTPHLGFSNPTNRQTTQPMLHREDPTLHLAWERATTSTIKGTATEETHAHSNTHATSVGKKGHMVGLTAGETQAPHFDLNFNQIPPANLSNTLRHDRASEALSAHADWCQNNIPVNSPFTFDSYTFQPSFKPLPTVIENTYINIPRLTGLLRGHPDKYLVEYMLDGLQNGFNLGFTGQIQQIPLRNNKSARDNPIQVTLAINKEVSRGHTAGPFLSPPFHLNHISPLGAAPKPDGSARLVLDLSQPRGSSVNDYIDKFEFPCSYMHFDEATEMVMRVGKACYMSKIDIKHAYRLLPVRQEDWPLLVYYWKGRYYVDLKLPFGGRSSASIFNSFADLICWILTQKFDLIVIHYSDDFLLITKSDYLLALAHLNKLKSVFAFLDIPVAEDKLIGPCTSLPFLGIQIDSSNFCLSIPVDKINEIISVMPSWCQRRTCTLKELQSLNGKLNFISRVIVAGRIFTRRLIDLSTTVTNPNHYVTINREARDDIHWWCELLHTSNKSSFIPDPKRIYSTDILLFTDAAKQVGLGACYGNSWIQAKWADHSMEDVHDINFLELFAIMAAVLTWGRSWSGKRIVIVTDNKTITHIWSSGTSPIPKIMDLIRKIYLFAASNKFSLSLKHIFGHFNPVADALSRFQVDRFRQLMPTADKDPTAIPEEVWVQYTHTCTRGNN